MSNELVNSRPLVYVAGPYSKPYPVHNMTRAIHVGTLLVYMGYTPVVPHLSGTWDMVTPLPYPVWLSYDLAVLGRCDVLLRIPGESSGSDGEVEHALKYALPVVYSLNDLLDEYLPADGTVIPEGQKGLLPQSLSPQMLVDLLRNSGIEVSSRVTELISKQMACIVR